MTQSLLAKYLSASNELHESVLRYQEVVEEIADHARRLRSLSDMMQDFASNLDTPGEVITLPRGIKPKDEAAA